jgi:probable rRNA maturation factor
MEISIAGLGRFPGAADRDLESWLARLVAALAPGWDSFAVRFVGDRAMRDLNRRFRGLDGPTDVLSFEGASGPDGRHLGDVVISVPYARRQAVAGGRSLAVELRVLALHGLLHCLGYDHEADDGEMARLERRLRRRFLGAEAA